MKPEGNRELLHDVLDGGLTPAASSEILTRTLKAVRARRRLRRSLNGIATCLVLAGMIVLFRNPSPTTQVAIVRENPAPSDETPNHSVVARVHSQPLPSLMQVKPPDTVNQARVLKSSPLEIVATRSEGDLFQRIGDDELVELTGEPSAVIHIGQDSARLVRLAGVSR
jgi:hypothetical protein